MDPAKKALMEAQAARSGRSLDFSGHFFTLASLNPLAWRLPLPLDWMFA
jgi:hypothetical protein